MRVEKPTWTNTRIQVDNISLKHAIRKDILLIDFFISSHVLMKPLTLISRLSNRANLIDKLIQDKMFPG